MGLISGDLRVQGWNCNSITKEFKTWKQFINKLENSNENCFILCDTRFEKEHEMEFEKLMNRPIFFNSFNRDQRGLVVLLKETLPAKNIKIENIISGDYTRLTFVVYNTKILIKCCYAPNEDMTSFESESENYSDKFFKTVFDDSQDLDYNISIMVGDFNVAPDHTKNTLGYLHVNNQTRRRFIDRTKSLNMMTDVYRHKHPDLRQFTFSKRQAKNYTKAHLDYFLINDDALDPVKKVEIGKESIL